MTRLAWVVATERGPVFRPGHVRREIDPETGRDRHAIYADAPIEVDLRGGPPGHARYYRRRIAVGDLVVVEAPNAAGREE